MVPVVRVSVLHVRRCRLVRRLVEQRRLRRMKQQLLHHLLRFVLLHRFLVFQVSQYRKLLVTERSLV
jgi:hypothetical protein